MATYNGEAYVREQVESIRRQMASEDELIVVDDCSTDATVGILESLNDPRIKLLKSGVNQGYVSSFGRAMVQARNEFVLLSDQDDIWTPGRKDLLMQSLVASGKSLVASNFGLVDVTGKHLPNPRFQLFARDSSRWLRNVAGIFLGDRPYFGCSMAFRRELLALVLPIPSFVESHDLWIALAGNMARAILHVERITLNRRIHEGNVSAQRRRAAPMVLKARLIFAMSVVVIMLRLLKRRLVRKD